MERHDYHKGDWVFVINQSGNTFFIEGKAEVLKPDPTNENTYLVRFRVPGVKLRDRWESYTRYVDPAAQDDPYDYVSRLNATARAARGAVDA